MTDIKKHLAAAAVAIASVCAFTACSDKEDEPTGPVARTIEGSYQGDLSCTVMGSESVFENLDYKVIATDDNTVSIILPAFGEAPMAMPSITVPGVKVSGHDDAVVLASTETSGRTDTDKAYTMTLTGDVTGGTLNVKFNLQYGSMPMPLICSIAAQKR